jgi:hypothetical protein
MCMKVSARAHINPVSLHSDAGSGLIACGWSAGTALLLGACMWRNQRYLVGGGAHGRGSYSLMTPCQLPQASLAVGALLTTAQ